jgi:TetR/AcrR family transcriptional repressor of nem operon
LPALAGDVSRMTAPIRRRFAHGFEQLVRALAGLVRELGYDEDEAMETASSIFSEMAGAIALARAVDAPEEAAQIRERSRRSIARRLGLEAEASGAATP